MFVDFDINDIQISTLLSSDSSLMQSDGKLSYKNEGNVDIQSNSFQNYEEENDIFMNTTYETHVLFLSSSDVIRNVDFICKLERDKIISHVVLDIDDFKGLHRNMMVMKIYHAINSKFEHGRKNEVICCKVMSNSHFVSFQFNNDDISLKKTLSIKPLSESSNHNPDKFLFYYHPNEISILCIKD
jgi:hypothetical protein